MFTAYKMGDHFKTTKWLLAMGKVVNRFFVMTLVANFWFADSGYCQTLETEGDCLALRNLDQVDTLCVWNSQGQQCQFQTIRTTFLPLLVITIIVCFFTLPLDSIYGWAVLKIQHYAGFTL